MMNTQVLKRRTHYGVTPVKKNAPFRASSQHAALLCRGVGLEGLLLARAHAVRTYVRTYFLLTYATTAILFFGSCGDSCDKGLPQACAGSGEGEDEVETPLTNRRKGLETAE